MSYDTHYQCDAPACKSTTNDLSKFGSGWVAWSRTGYAPYRVSDSHSCSAKCARVVVAKLGADVDLLAHEEAEKRPDLVARIAGLERELQKARVEASAAKNPITHQDVREAASEVFREVKNQLEHLPRGIISSVVNMSGNAIKSKASFLEEHLTTWGVPKRWR